jgi:Plant transposon protein
MFQGQRNSASLLTEHGAYHQSAQRASQLQNPTLLTRVFTILGTMTSSSESDSAEAFALLSANVAIAIVATAAFDVHRRRNIRAHGGSHIGKAPSRNLGRREGAETLDRDYFSRGGGSPVFTELEFERRYRMPRETCELIRKIVLLEDPYFEQKPDAIGALGASTGKKMAAALRQLTQGVAADAIVEYVRISESTASVCLKRFCSAVVSGLKDEYLRLPNMDELRRIESEYASLGLPGAIGCCDCASGEWDACPLAWQGTHIGK